MSCSKEMLRYALHQLSSGNDEFVECTHVEKPESLSDPEVCKHLVQAQNESAIAYCISQLLKNVPEKMCKDLIDILHSDFTRKFSASYYEEHPNE